MPLITFANKFSIVGNAGSGKTTLAKKIAEKIQVPILDLDNITWDRARLQKRRPIDDSIKELENFILSHPAGWIIEGCYGELIEQTLTYSPKLVFIDPGEAKCIENCRHRPWEKHKYSSKEEQDKFLQFLLSWVAEYYRREGPMSYQFHRLMYDNYKGPKQFVESALLFA